MNSYIENFRTPGQLIETLMESRGWSQRILAIVLDIDPASISKIISGQKAVDAELAISLGEVFGVDEETFLELQKSYDLARARITARPDPGRRRRAHLFGDLPIRDMAKRGWLDLEIENINNLPKVESALTKFFGVSNPDDIEILPHANKKTAVTTPPTPAQLAWIYRVKQIASEMLVAKYSQASGQKAIARLSNLLMSAEEARKVPRIMTEAGIRFVIVEALPSTKIDGVCFWLNESSPVVGLSLRYDRIDNFWFVLRHEIEHVLCRHGLTVAMLDADLEGERAGSSEAVAEEERIANKAAAEFCVPQKSLEKFIARKAPLFPDREILGFAKTLQIHPGLVAGQLQHHTGLYNRFRKHLVQIRNIVVPGAIVDGWGDVAPIEC